MTRCLTFRSGDFPKIPPAHPVYRKRVDARLSLSEAAGRLGVGQRTLGDVEHNRQVNEELVARAFVLYEKIVADKAREAHDVAKRSY